MDIAIFQPGTESYCRDSLVRGSLSYTFSYLVCTAPEETGLGCYEEWAVDNLALGVVSLDYGVYWLIAALLDAAA